MNEIRGSTAELLGDDARHLTRVLRVQIGQRFEVSDNHNAWLAEVSEARGERVVFRLIEPLDSTPLPVRITLIAAIVKFDHFEWMIEKATELGVESIVPVETARTEKGLFEASKKRVERWRKIARESSQQSRRTTVPDILASVRFETSLSRAADQRYFLDEAGAPALVNVLPEHRVPEDRVALMIGPEGGWTDDERESAKRALWTPASLGPLILRAETAAIAALAVTTNAWTAANSLQ